MGASFLPLMMFTLLWGGVGIVLPFLVPKGATQGLPDSSGNDPESQNPSDNLLLSFHPKYFDFKESPVGVPRLGLVRVDNRLKNENLKLISISGNTVHFHSSFFADKVIGPESNTTFEVVFLSRVEGLVESNLYIHTSKGLFKYFVKGIGLPNPYRLKPLVGARIPVNGTYEPLITMHNTHDTRIQVVEMHSSGADFHLQLPDEVEQNAAGSAWAIEPFETKSVMKGSFQGKADGNHTGFIKIRVNSTAESSEYLLLPVEVQVSSEPGMYSPQDSLDFGLLVQSDKPKTLSLFIINAERVPVNVQSVSVKGAPNPAVRIEFRPVVIEPDNSVSTVVALVTFDPSQAIDPKYSHGVIHIVSECGKSVAVPFRATVMNGELEYNASSLGFFVKSEVIPPRNFSVRNNFSTTVAIYHVAVSHPDIVKVNNFNYTHIIPPGEQKTIFSLKVQRKGEICDARNKIEVTVKSNITNVKLPLTCYDGKLALHTFENGEIDCGRLEANAAHTEYFSVENKNPVEIRLKSWGSNSSWGNVELVGMQKGGKEDLEKIKDFDSLTKSLFLQPHHMAVFSIDIRRPAVEGTYYGEAYVTTDHNQTLRVPFRFAVSKGSVYSDTVVFDKVFPGKISCEKLYLDSSFNRTLFLSTVRSRPPKLLSFSPSPSENPEIPPMRRSYVGKLHFDPRKFCDADCYAGFNTDSAIGKLWMSAATRLGWEGGETDWDILTNFQKRFEAVSDSTVSNISVWVDTNEMGGYKVLTQVKYIWPRITSLRPVVFPLTALGNESMVEIPISNPSSFPLLVQALLSSDYGPLWSRFVPGYHSVFSGSGNSSTAERAFKLSGIFSSSSQQNNSIDISDIQLQHFRAMLEESGESGVIPGLAFVVPPGVKYYLRTVFQPQSKDMANTVILLRNNLTGIEAISAKGRAGMGQLTVGSGIPGSALLFQLTEKLLQACQTEPTSKYVPPQLTVRRSFVARNIGEIPLDIRAVEIYPPESSLFGFPWHLPFDIGGGGGGGYFGGSSYYTIGENCEGYGFRILNCHSFTLQPNHTHSIDIAFSPDFTMSKVVRTLRLIDSTGGEFNYTLVAMIPSKMLSICSSVISRPSWEYLLKIFLVISVIVAIVAAALMAYVEAGSVVSSTVVATVRVMPQGEACIGRDGKENTSKLDLKAVYDKVENRFKRSQKEGSGKTPIASGYPATANAGVGGAGMGNSGGKASQQMSNGTISVLANNNNSALRNRRLKKGSLDQSNLVGGSSSGGAATNFALPSGKLMDKSNQNKSSSHPSEDNIGSMSSSGGTFSKKNKENSPTNGDGTSGGMANSANVSNTKKKKGSAPFTTPTSQNAQINNNNPSIGGGGGGKQKKRRNSGGGSTGSITNICLVSGGVSSKGLSKAEQEETSSTTTESSNSDDFYIGPTDKKGQQQQAKGSKSANSFLQNSSSGSAGAPGQQKMNNSKTGKQEANSKKKRGQEGGNPGKPDGLDRFDGTVNQKPASPVMDDSSSCSSGGNRKKNGKRKDQQQGQGNVFNVDSVMSGKGVDGKVSPGGRPHMHHQDMAMWDSPQTSAGDGLSELAAQTEAFVMHRPSSRSSKKSGPRSEHMVGGTVPPDMSRYSRNSHSPPFCQVLQQMAGNTNFQLQQQMMHMGNNSGMRHRRPTAGIIGQSRYGMGNGGIVSPTASYYSPQILQSSGHPNRQHTPPNRTQPHHNSAAGMPMNNGWGTDILPDNGCDIWNRKNSSESAGAAGGGLGQTFSSVAGSSVTSSIASELYSSGNMMPNNYSSIFEGFPATSSPGLSNRSSDDGGYYSLGSGNCSNNAITTSTSGAPNAGPSFGGNSSRSGGRNGNENSQVFNYPPMELFNTLNNLSFSCGTYDNLPAAYRSQVSGGSSVRSPQAPRNPSGGGSSSSSHNYLQRMRSEPTSRDENRGLNWNDLSYYDVDGQMGATTASRILSRSSNSPSGLEGGGNTTDEMAWPATSSAGDGGSGSSENLSRDRGLYSNWAAALGSSTSAQGGRQSVGNVSEIWEPAAIRSSLEPSSKWPTSTDPSGSEPASGCSGGPRGSSTAMLGEGSLGNLGFPTAVSRSSDIPQSHHREVEAGLGFNPFTSNIWNQNHSSDTNWTTSSTSSFHFNNNRE